MKRILGVCLFLICIVNISVSAKNRSYKFAYDLNGKRTNEVSLSIFDLVWKDSNEYTLIIEEDEPRIDIESIILDRAKENECLIMMDFKTDDTENPYPEIESMNIRINKTNSVSGGRLRLIGRDYRLFYFGENVVEDVSDSIIRHNLLNAEFSVNKLGKYVLFFNPDVYDIVFYMDEPIPTEEGDIMPEIYHKIEGLNKQAIVEFPTVPEKEGYIFTGWKAWSGSGIYFTVPQPLTALDHNCYYASWCPEDEYEPISIEISSSEPIIKGKEDGKKITLKTNYGLFVKEDEFPTEWRNAYDSETDEQAKADLLADWKSKWNVAGSDDVMIETATRIDDKTVELVLSGNSDDIYKNSEIQIEFDSSLLMPEPYEINGEIIDWDDTKIKMDEYGVRARMYRSDNSIKLSKQSRPGRNVGLRIPKYTITFETNGGSNTQKQVVSKNTVARMPEMPEKDGYVFAGWFLDKEFKTEYDFNSKATKNITLFAKWEEADRTKDQIIFTVGKTTALVFGVEKENDVAPLIRGDRTYLPVRFVAENLGAVVEWNGDKQEVTIEKEDIKIILTIGENKALINGEVTDLDSPAFIKNERTYTPIRFIAEKLGCDVEWNDETKEIVVTK